MNNILAEVDYKKYQWEVCGDFKVTAVLLGLLHQTFLFTVWVG